MRERRCSPVAPTAEFARFARAIELLLEHGIPEKALDALIREKILADLAKENARRRQPSLN